MSPPANARVALPTGTFRAVEYKDRGDGHARKLVTASPVAGSFWILRVPPSFLHSPDPIAEKNRKEKGNTVNTRED